MGIVVLGMHRSGTSLLIGLLQVFGYYLGHISNKASKLKPTGTKENILLRKINNQLLVNNGYSWDNPSCLLTLDDKTLAMMKCFASDLREVKWAIKDPRLLLTYHNWSNILPEHKIIATLRHPILVAQSLMIKNNMEETKALHLWLAYSKTLLSLWKKKPFPIINFDLSINDYYKKLKQHENYLNTIIEEKPFHDFYNHQLTSTILPSLEPFPETMDIYQQLLKITGEEKIYEQ